MSIFGLRWYGAGGVPLGLSRSVIVPIDTGAATGGGAVTLDDAGLIGAGTISSGGAVTGAGAIVSDDAGVSGAGTVSGSAPATGSGATTLDDAVAAGAGTVAFPPVTGAGAATLDDAGVVSGGVVVPAVATTGNAVEVGDSIARGGNYGSELGSIERMGFAGGVTIVNKGVGSLTALQMFDRLVAGGANGIDVNFVAGQSNVASFQGGTNDIGSFEETGANVYNLYVAPWGRLAAAKGYYSIARTLLGRGDALWSGTNETERQAYNALLVANATGAFDSVLDMRGDSAVGDGSGTTNRPDLLHPNDSMMLDIGLRLLKPVVNTQLLRPARTNREVTISFASSPTYAAGKFGMGIASGGSFINTPPVPVDNSVRPLTIEMWVKPASTSAQGIFGKLDNPGGSPQFLVGIDGSGKYYMNINNGASVVATSVSAAVGTWAYLRFIMLSGSTKLEVDGANQVSTATAVGSGGTRAIRYQTLDGAHGVADFGGVVSGFASWDGDRSGVANPTGHLLPNTTNLRAYYPFERHLLGWN